MSSLIWILFILAYAFIGAIISKVSARLDGETSVMECSHPGHFFTGLFWPLMLPILLGTKIGDKICDWLNLVILVFVLVSCGPPHKDQPVGSIEYGPHRHIYSVTITDDQTVIEKECCDYTINEAGTRVRLYCMHSPGGGWDPIYDKTSYKLKVDVERK